MLRLITGIPGAGKTLYAVSLLKKAVEENAALPPSEQRKIYSDITGLKIEGIEPPPLDWRETPPRSLLVYDEAQFHKPFQPTRGLSAFDYIQELTIHRKTGHEIWYITQDPKRLHSNILDMVEQHHHLDRPYGAKLATIFKFRGVERITKSEAAKERAESKTLFNYDKKLFSLYQSSQVDDGIKLRLPPKLIFFVSLPILLMAFAAYMFTTDGSKKMLTGGDKKYDTSISNVTDNIASAVPAPAVVSSSELPKLSPVEHTPYPMPKVVFEQVATVVSNGNHCIAKDYSGKTLDISSDECLIFADNPYSASYIPMDALTYVYVDENLPNEPDPSL